jgi:Fe2+ or Zn2+ uptake regulation protein
MNAVGHDGTQHEHVSALAITGHFERLGLRATRPRRLIAERIAALGANGGDFTTEDLWRELRESEPGIGRATVFRSIDLLVRDGFVDRVQMGSGKHRYRVCGPYHHHHVTCTTCDRTVEIDYCLSPDMISAVASSTDFAIEGHSLELFGRCPACRRKVEG